MLHPRCFYVRNGKCYKDEPCELHMRQRNKKIVVKAKLVTLADGSLSVIIDKTDHIVSKSDPDGWRN